MIHAWYNKSFQIHHGILDTFLVVQHGRSKRTKELWPCLALGKSEQSERRGPAGSQGCDIFTEVEGNPTSFGEPALGLWALQATRGRARARRGGCLPISLIHRDLPSWGNLKFPEGSGDQRLIPYRKSWFAWEALQVGEGGLSVLPTLVRCSYVWKVVLSSHWRGPSGTGDCSSFGWDDWTLWRKQWMMQRSCSRWNHFDPKS